MRSHILLPEDKFVGTEPCRIADPPRDSNSSEGRAATADTILRRFIGSSCPAHRPRQASNSVSKDLNDTAVCRTIIEMEWALGLQKSFAK